MEETEHFKGWEHVYRATGKNGEDLRLAAHEWGDWFEDEELEGDRSPPDGAIYYAIYSKRADGVWEESDGGVLGYRYGDFKDMDGFRQYLGRFMAEANQGVVINEPLDNEEKFWEEST